MIAETMMVKTTAGSS